MAAAPAKVSDVLTYGFLLFYRGMFFKDMKPLCQQEAFNTKSIKL